MSIDVFYRDEKREKHYFTIAPEDLGPTSDKSVVGVVYDPHHPSRATTETALSKPLWSVAEGPLVIVGVSLAVMFTGVIWWAFHS
ncbi:MULTISPECIES: hypothetical protein [unclassified Streptomyces]